MPTRPEKTTGLLPCSLVTATQLERIAQRIRQFRTALTEGSRINETLALQQEFLCEEHDLEIAQALESFAFWMREKFERVLSLLVEEHIKTDPTIQAVFFVPNNDDEIRLIEITPSVPPDGKVFPFRFAEDAAIPYKSLIVLLHPDDWGRQRELEWPRALDPAVHNLEQLHPQVHSV